MAQENQEVVLQAGNYRFSTPPMDQIGASEYTLVTLVIDASGSVEPFKSQLETMLKTVLKACGKSPRAENLMLRVVQFDTHLKELHGFRLLSTIKETDYTNILQIGATTALFEAATEAIEVTAAYGKTLTNQEFLVNGLVVIVTDGLNNCAPHTSHGVLAAVKTARKAECLESILIVLVGVIDPKDSQAAYTRTALEDFQKTAEITQFVDIGEATPGKIAKLGQFVSQSVSSQSQSLGSKGPSQPVTF